MSNKPVRRDKPGRAELEARLAAASGRITDRFEKLENSLPKGPVDQVRRLWSDRRIRNGLLIGAGSLVGLLLVTRSRRRVGSYDEGLNAVSDRLARAVVDRLRAGASPEDAVREAVDDVPPVLHLRESAGIASQFVSILSKTVSSVVAREVGSYLVSYLSRVREDSNEV